MSLLNEKIKVQSHEKVKQFMTWMRRVPFIYVPFFFIPFPASAEPPAESSQFTNGFQDTVPPLNIEPEVVATLYPGNDGGAGIESVMNAVPAGFEQFPALNEGVLGSILDMNKHCIIQLQEML